MNRRTFLKLLLGVSTIHLALTKPAHSPSSDIRILNIIFSELFPPGLISASIEEDLDRIEPHIKKNLKFSADSLIQMAAEADMISLEKHNRGFIGAGHNEQRMVVDRLMANYRHVKTYRNVRDLLFADPIYLLNRNREAWDYLGYEEHNFPKQKIIGS
jgi:hypothetical protein